MDLETGVAGPGCPPISGPFVQHNNFRQFFCLHFFVKSKRCERCFFTFSAMVNDAETLKTTPKYLTFKFQFR